MVEHGRPYETICCLDAITALLEAAAQRPRVRATAGGTLPALQALLAQASELGEAVGEDNPEGKRLLAAIGRTLLAAELVRTTPGPDTSPPHH